MAFVALFSYLDSIGDSGPSEEEIEKSIEEEIYRIFKIKNN
jgi:hypothetical protein